MSTFTINGTVEGAAASVTWTDGVLIGDTVILTEAFMLGSLGQSVAIPGVWAGVAGVKDHAQALATLLFIFDPRVTVTGDELDVSAPDDPVDGAPDPDAPDGAPDTLIVVN